MRLCPSLVLGLDSIVCRVVSGNSERFYVEMIVKSRRDYGLLRLSYREEVDCRHYLERKSVLSVSGLNLNISISRMPSLNFRFRHAILGV